MKQHRRFSAMRYWKQLFLLLCVVGTPWIMAQQSDTDTLRQEEELDYFTKWLEEDVLYIINDEEKAIFTELTTDDEKEQFIEQFWFRRDPDPRTASNEFKEEHYRRIAYANEHYTSGDPGWRTDRGRIYIIHGPPDNLETRPMGGAYVRKIEEGGGVTAVYPYEKWTYRYIEGLGNNVELEFVDDSDSGQYKLAVFPWEKEGAMRYTPGLGMTLAEQTGISTRADRPGMYPEMGPGYGAQSWFRRVSDTPFQRYETFAVVGGAPVTKYKDLKELVNVNIQYATLPFSTRQEYFRLNEDQVLVPITVEVENKHLSFAKEGGLNVGKMAIYGIVSSLTNRVVTEFEDDVVARYTDEELAQGLLKTSVYQKILPLDVKNRYKVDLVVKDLRGSKVGVLRQAIVPPTFGEVELEGSSLILSDQIEAVEEIPEMDEMFVLGDVKILPRLKNEFTQKMPLGIYFQVYNAMLDQSTLEPSLKVTFSLYHNGELLAQAIDEEGESIQFFSGRRVVLMKHLSLANLGLGKYRIQLEIVDRLNDRKLLQDGDFTIVDG